MSMPIERSLSTSVKTKSTEKKKEKTKKVTRTRQKRRRRKRNVETTKKARQEKEENRVRVCRLTSITLQSFLINEMIIKQRRNSHFTRSCIIFISYIAILQVLYALQTVLVSVPFVAIVSTVYLLIIQSSASSRVNPLNTFLNSTGFQIKPISTYERDVQDILVQQTEQTLQTNLEQFHKVSRC
jgi:Flp pilus assembly protein TadB